MGKLGSSKALAVVERGGELAVEVVADKRLNHWAGATCRITS